MACVRVCCGNRDAPLLYEAAAAAAGGGLGVVHLWDRVQQYSRWLACLHAKC